MIICTRVRDTETSGILVTAYSHVGLPEDSTFLMYRVLVQDVGEDALERAERHAKAKLQEALDADNPRD